MTYEIKSTLERKEDLNDSENKRGVVKNHALIMLFLDKGGLKKKVGAKVLSVHLIICLRSDFALFPSRILFTDFILSIFSLCRKASLLT